MGRRPTFLLGILLLSGVIAQPAAAAVPGPAGTWYTSDLGQVARDPCVAAFGPAGCTRPGGLAASGSDALLVSMGHEVSEFGVSDFAIAQRSTNGGLTFGPGASFTGGMDGTLPSRLPALSQRGADVDVVYWTSQVPRRVTVRHSPDLGETWGGAVRFAAPRDIVSGLAIARGPGGRVAYAVSAYDQVMTEGSAGKAVQVRVSANGGLTFPVRHVFSWTAGMCTAPGTEPSIAITDGGVIVLAWWRTCERLFVTRSADGGATWTAPATLSRGPHTLGTAIAASGSTVVVSYTIGARAYVRRSTDAGRSWSAPVLVGSGVTSIRLGYAAGAWRLLTAGTDRVRYRSSFDARSWGGGETVAQSSGSATYAVGVAVGAEVLAAYAIRRADRTIHLYVARRG
jgi:hypothetical protein